MGRVHLGHTMDPRRDTPGAAAIARSRPIAAGRPPPRPGSWAFPWIACAMVLIVVVKLHEVVPRAAMLRPGLLVSGLAVVAMAVSVHTRYALRSRPGRLLMAYVAIAIIGAPLAVYPLHALQTLQRFLPAVMVAVAILISAPTLRTLKTVLATFAGGAAVYALLLKTAGQIIRGGRFQLVESGTYDPNDSAMLLALALPLLAGFAVGTRGWSRWAAIIGLPILVAGVVATGSRGGTLGLVAGAAAFAFALRGLSRTTIAIAFVAIGMATWAYAGTGFQNRMRTMLNVEQDYNTHDDMGRIAIWKRGLGYVLQRPITGLGIDNFMMAEGLTLAEQERVGKWSGAHNAFLQSFAELGVPGGLVFLALLGYAARVGLFIRRQRDPAHVALGAALFGCTAAYAVTGVFLSHALSPVFFFLVGSTALAGLVFRYDGRASGVRPRKRLQPHRVGRPALPGHAPTRPL